MKLDRSPKSHTIFYNNFIHNVTTEDTKKSENLNGIPCKIYKIEFNMIEDGEEVNYTGKIWLNSNTGAPCKLEKTCKELPSMLKSFREVTEYSIDENGRWVTKSETTITDVSVLLMKLKLEVTYNYSDYWVYSVNLTN